MGLKWPIGRGEGVGAGESQREWKGWVPCPTGSLPFAHPMGCPLGHPNFTPWRHPTYRCYLRWPHRNFPRKPPMGKMLLEGGGGLSWVASVWYHTCLLSPAGQDNGVEENEGEDVHSSPNSPQHYHCLLATCLLPLTYHPNSTTFKQDQDTNNWSSIKSQAPIPRWTIHFHHSR